MNHTLVAISVIITLLCALSLNASLPQRSIFAVGWRTYLNVATMLTTTLAGGWLAHESPKLGWLAWLAGNLILLAFNASQHGGLQRAAWRISGIALPLGLIQASFWFTDLQKWNPGDRSSWYSLISSPLSLFTIVALQRIFREGMSEKKADSAHAEQIMRVVWIACLAEALAMVMATLTSSAVIADGGRLDIRLETRLLLGVCGLALVAIAFSAAYAKRLSPGQAGVATCTVEIPGAGLAALLVGPILLLMATVVAIVNSWHTHGWTAVCLPIIYGATVVDSLISNSARHHVVGIGARAVTLAAVVGVAVSFLVTWSLVSGIWAQSGKPVTLLGIEVVAGVVLLTCAALTVAAGHALAKCRPYGSVTETSTELNLLQDSVQFQALVLLAGMIPIVAFGALSSPTTAKITSWGFLGLVLAMIVFAIGNNKTHLAEERNRTPQALLARSQVTGESFATLNATRIRRLGVRLQYQNLIAVVILLLGAVWVILR